MNKQEARRLMREVRDTWGEFRYEIARTERDARRATSLASRYPQWREAVALARRLGAS